VIAITRYRVPEGPEAPEAPEVPEGGAAADFQAKIASVLAALGRWLDEPDLWALVTEWEGAGYYRRALGAYEVRMTFIPLSALAVDEPGAYEVVKPG
jgi:hypothetical protein